MQLIRKNHSLQAGAVLLLILTVGMPIFVAAAAELSQKEAKRRDENQQYDRQELRTKDTFVTDTAAEFIKKPEAEFYGEYTVAAAPPTVRFRIFPELQPEYFGEGVKFYQAGWSNWGYVTRHASDNRFFFGAADHRGRGAQLNVYEYSHDRQVLKRVLDVSALLGWTADSYTDGKLHGHMGIMPDGTLWSATHYGVKPDQEWFAAGYRGSWLFSYNIDTGAARNWGVPLIVHDLACHALDPARGIFLGTGSFRGMMLCWDVNRQQTRFAGYPPNGWVWHPRSMLLDPATGVFWGNDISEKPYRFLAFNPELNEFKRFEVEVPANPVSGVQSALRGHTHEPDNDGWFYWSTTNGAFFRFRPDWETGPVIEELGTNWDKGRDVLQIVICPNKRYIYYQPKGRPERGVYSPLVQYDIQTGTRKAVCFLQDYFFAKYGYTTGSQVYGLAVSHDGAAVIIVENGTFGPYGKVFGHPGLMIIEIPESERPGR